MEETRDDAVLPAMRDRGGRGPAAPLVIL